MDETLDLLLARARARVGSLMLFDADEQALKIVAARGFCEETMEQIRKLKLIPGQGIAGHVYQTGQPYFLKNPQEDPLFVQSNDPLGPNFQFLSLPLKNDEGKTVGVLNIHFPTEAVLNPTELGEFLKAANQLIGKSLPFPLKGLPSLESSKLPC